MKVLYFISKIYKELNIKHEVIATLLKLIIGNRDTITPVEQNYFFEIFKQYDSFNDFYELLFKILDTDDDGYISMD